MALTKTAVQWSSGARADDATAPLFIHIARLGTEKLTGGSLGLGDGSALLLRGRLSS
ncbi:hypothetical protein [Geobacillus jurassicus]|uniref:Uncharacterized protein n=1 Tax=Geobacillus jurassicus TaxID=235932 RepID=A0ABV6GX87_9BACL|nr:hypothetical protein [Geobacillus jurassicus]